jgi:transcriptional regulator with XRE-family HTH domain
MKLRVWRALHGLSQQQVAEKAGVGSKMNISRYERAPDHRHFRPPMAAHYLRLRELTGGAVLYDDYLRPWTDADRAALEAARGYAAGFQAVAP